VLIKNFSTHKCTQLSLWSFLKCASFSQDSPIYVFILLLCWSKHSQPTNILQFKYSVIIVEFPQIRFLPLLHSVFSLLPWKLLAIPPTGGGRERGKRGVRGIGRKEGERRGAHLMVPMTTYLMALVTTWGGGGGGFFCFFFFFLNKKQQRRAFHQYCWGPPWLVNNSLFQLVSGYR